MATFASIISLFYLIIFFMMAVAALFIVYHIRKYSLSPKHAFLGTVFFLTVFAVLALSNVTAFTRIDFTALIPQKVSTF